MINECYFAINYLNSNFTSYALDKLSKDFIHNIFTENEYGNLVAIIHNSLCEIDTYKKKEQTYLKQEAKKILNSFLYQKKNLR